MGGFDMIRRRLGQGLEHGIEQVGLEAIVLTSSIDDGFKFTIRHGRLSTLD